MAYESRGSQHDHEASPHVLVIGIDGTRYDAVRRLSTPNLDRIADAGFLTAVRVDECAPTISGPSWASIFTGTLASTHRIFDNDLSTGQLTECPDVITAVTRVYPEVETFAAAGWAPLVTADSGGPLLAGGGFFPADLADNSVDELHRVDDDVVRATTDFLLDHDGKHGSLIFGYLHGVDAVGHNLGTGDEYDAMIESSDARVGQLLDVVARRPDEEWTVVVVTDHGHRDGGGHGGDDIHERTAWVAACGPGIPAEVADGSVQQVDVAGQILHQFGVDAVSNAVVGRRFGR